MKGKKSNFWTGNQNRERQIALSAPTSFLKVLNTYSIGKKKGTEVRFGTTQDILLDTQVKNHIVKLEAREQGAFDFQYNSAELRYRSNRKEIFGIS